jgi:putative transposase
VPYVADFNQYIYFFHFHIFALKSFQIGKRLSYKMINLNVGMHVFAKGTQVRVLEMLGVGRVTVQDISTGAIFVISPGEIEFELKSTDKDTALASKVLHSIDSTGKFIECEETAGTMAVEQFHLIKNMLDAGAQVKHIIKQLMSLPNVNQSRAYRILNRFNSEQGPLSLLDSPKGRKLGSKSIAVDLEKIIHQAISSEYVGVAANQAVVIQKVHDLCSEANLKPPANKTIISRLKSHNPRELLSKKQGSKKAKQKYEVRGGKLLTKRPLEIVQIDHGLVDCIIVDGETRTPLCRPWVTLAIDLHTRVILGMHVTLCYPSGMSVALCVSHMILPKYKWLKEIAMQSCEYPFYGLPRRIHVDNAKEFKSPVLKGGCAIYGIKLTWRPPGTPHNGAHIERLIGTMMGKVHFLPGTTMSSIVQKGDYNPEKHAALTFTEFREWFVREVEIYHKTNHSKLGCSPLFKWEESFRLNDGSISNPPIISESQKLLLDFMPLKRRVISRSGVKLFNIEYYDPALKNFNNGTQCVVRYDPLSVKYIWVKPACTDQYIRLTYSDLSLPDASLEELKFIRKLVKERSGQRVSQTEILELKKRNSTLVSTAETNTKKARAINERSKLRQDKSHPLHDNDEVILNKNKTTAVNYSLKPVPFRVEE